MAEVELFDVAAGTSSSAKTAGVRDRPHRASAARWACTGRRGPASDQRLIDTEVFDRASNTSGSGPSLNQARSGHSGTVPSDSRSLGAGGDDAGTAEIFDPVS